MSDMDKIIDEIETFDKKVLSLWGFVNSKIELFGINSPDLYVLPREEEVAIKKALDIIISGIASVVVSGPLGAGKTTFLEMLEHSLKKKENIRIIRVEGISSADSLIDDIMNAEYYPGISYSDFWNKKIGVRMLKHGSISKRLTRLLLAMRKDAEKNGVTYVIEIDEFRQLERMRDDTRTRLVDMLLRMVNDKTLEGRRYLVLVLAVITRVGESAYRTLEILSSVGENLGHGVKSAIRRRFVEIYNVGNVSKATGLRIMINRLAQLKNKINEINNFNNFNEINENILKELIKPFTLDGLETVYSYSGGNPGSMLELLIKLLYDAIRGTDLLSKEGYSLDEVAAAYQIDTEYVIKFASKAMSQTKAELTEFQKELLEFLEEPRNLNDIEKWLNSKGKNWDDVIDDFDLFEKRGLIYSPTTGQIQATELWIRGSKYA